ncbi:Outer membrane protein assembly factor BamA [bacterium HR30]|nr:Outer membrane protein assembly factor BamA [bacterium HR30]
MFALSRRNWKRTWLLLAIGLLGWARDASSALEEQEARPIVALEVRGELPWQQGEVAAALSPILALGWDNTTENVIRDRLRALGRYREVHIQATPSEDGVRLSVVLEPKSLVRTVRYRGYQALPLRELERVARIGVGMAVDDQVLNGVRQRLLALYRDQGLPEAEVRVEVTEPERGEAEVVVSIAEGRPQVVRQIDWVGFEVDDPSSFLRMLPVRIGQRWTQGRAKETGAAALRYLRQRGYFEARVEPKFEEAAVGSGLLRLHIRPGPRCEVVLEGNKAVTRDEIFDAARLWQRSLVTDGTWRQVRRVAEQLYQEKGYYLARVQLQVERPDPERKLIRITVDEGPVLRVRKVEFEGRRGVPARRLREVMVTGPPSWKPWRDGFLVTSRFEEDLKRIWFRYREFGFVDAEITDYRIQPDPKKGAIDVAIVVSEGSPVTVERIDFVGLPTSFPQPRLREVRVRRPLDPFALEREAQRVSQLLRDAGFGDATVEGQWEVREESGEQRRAVVTFEVHTGPRYRVGQILVGGNIQTASSLIRSESRLRPGASLTAESLATAQSRLYQLGLFRGVEVEALPRTDSVPLSEEVWRDVMLWVQERAPVSVTFGGGYNTRDGFRAFGELAHLNLAHRGERLGLRGDVALDPAQAAVPNEYLLDLGFRDPQFWETSWAFRVNAIGQRATRSVDQFSIERLALVPAIERRWRPALLTGLEMQIEQARVFDLRPDARAFNPGDEGQLTTGSVGPFVVYEGRDDPFLPRRGVFDSIRLRLAPAFLGSDEPLAKLQWHHSHYIPLGQSLTWVYALRGGWARTFRGGVVPIRERFFLGGRSTVRGFSENSIGPLGAPVVDPLGTRIFPGGNPLGGDLSLNANTELRFPLLWGAVGLVFVDGGGVYLQDRSVSVADFRRSAGLGLLYETPVGPLALHYGIKLDRRPGEAFGAVHFTIGTLF